MNDAERISIAPSSLVDDAHAAGLFVHTWTFRNESQVYLTKDYQNHPTEEYLQFYCLDIDGLFADFPDTALTARALLRLAPGTRLQSSRSRGAR